MRNWQIKLTLLYTITWRCVQQPVAAVFLLRSIIVAYWNIILPLTRGRLGDIYVLALLLAAIRDYVDDDDGGDNGNVESRNGVS
jgi:hypothetical protein